MPYLKFRILLLTGLYFCAGNIFAQPAEKYADSLQHTNITVVYDITAVTAKKNAEIEEAYNGGIKTLMITKDKAKIRLVSLMRIQSQYFYTHDSLLTKVLIIKESGKKKYKSQLSPAAWKQLNVKYNNLSYSLVKDSVSILGYNCKKAIIKLEDGKLVTAYYSTTLKPVDKNIEPLFCGLPGMVLRYEHETAKGHITFTANKVSFESFDTKIFKQPEKAK